MAINVQYQKWMRLKVYMLTFSGMMILYMLRAGYSYSKPYIKRQYKFSNFFLSLVDASQFIGLGIAYLLKYLIFDQKYTINQFKNSGTAMAICYILIPLLPLFPTHIISHFQIALLISSFLFGFLQFSFQPTLSRQMKKYYNSQDNEVMFTCWDAGKHLGRILGYIFMQLAVISMSIAWEASLFILIAALGTHIGLIYYYCDYNQVETLRQSYNPNFQEEAPENTDISWGQFMNFGKQCMVRATTRYYILLSCCYKALTFNFTYWLSVYLFSYSFPQLSGKVTLVFIIPIFLGNFLIGKMHQDAISDQQSLTTSNIFLIVSGLITFGGLAYLSGGQLNYIQFVLIIMIEGFVIGGFYNILKSNKSLVCGDFNKREKDMFDTFLNAMVNFAAAIVTLSIGILMSIRTGIQGMHVVQVGSSIFQVMEVVSILGLILLILWILAIYEKVDNDRNSYESELNQLQL